MTPQNMTPLEMAVWANVYSSRFRHGNETDSVKLANHAVECMRLAGVEARPEPVQAAAEPQQAKKGKR